MEKTTLFQKKIGINIKELRNTKNLTQEGLGVKSGLNYKYIGAVERGERNLSLKSIKKIADGLEVDVKALFELSGIKISEKSPPKTEREYEIAKVYRLLQTASIAKLRLAYKLLRVLFE